MNLIRPIMCLSLFCLFAAAVSLTAEDSTAAAKPSESKKACCAEKCSGEQKACCEKKLCSEKKTCSEKKSCCAEKTCSEKKACCSEKACSDKKTCSADKSACGSGKCPIETAMAQLPEMTYLVGDKATCCSESADAMAKKTEQPTQYVVGEEKFDSKAEAMTTLVSKTEAMVSKFTTPSKCKVSGTTTIAGHSCKCPVEAGENIEKVNSAVALVSMKYKVGEETCGCPDQAKTLAKKAGETPVFVVDGVETSCELTARLTLARAKYKAAVQSLAARESAQSEQDS